MEEFVSGATMAASAGVALFFVRFFRQTGDRLFAAFALAFTVFGVNRLLLTLLDDESEAEAYVYMARFLAFALIIAAIVDKNRGGSPGGDEAG